MTLDLKVRITATDLSTYPDASVVCGPLARDAVDDHAITNPVLVVEVTSPTTEDSDRGEKLSHYKQLTSLQTIVIVSHRTHRLSVIEREGSGWKTTEFRSSETARTTQPPLELEVDAVYAALAGI